MSQPFTLSAAQMRTLEAACDALIPRLHVADDPHLYYATGASDLDVPAEVARIIASLPRASQRAQLSQLLTALEHPLAGLLVGRPRRFSRMSRAEREVVLRRWASSPIPLQRTGFQALKRLTCFAYYTARPETGNPAWQAIGYPGAATVPPPTPKPIIPEAVTRDTTLECDAVIIGSGAGGGTAAALLAAAGKRVIILEQGNYYNEADFTDYEAEMLRRLYLEDGLLSTRDLGVLILAGRCLGGGTVVNYTTSFPTPDTLRQEWAAEHGLPDFTSAAYDHALDLVMRRLSVNRDNCIPSHREEILARGLDALGWHRDFMPRDVVDCSQADDCGWCVLGCRRGAKQSTMKTFLQDAYDNGAQIIVNCDVRRILSEHGRAAGVEAIVGGQHRLTVRAKAVVVAAGSIYSPALLLRSGLRNPNIGRHLHLHPTTGIWGRFKEPVQPWTGTMQTVYSDQFTQLSGNYGVKLETAPIHPTVFLYASAWQSGKQHKDMMRQLPYVTPIGLLTRDLGGGRITIDRDGIPLVDYRLSRFDLANMRRAAAGAAQILAAAGAEEIFTTQTRYASYHPAYETVATFMQRADHIGWTPNQTGYLSYHQMSTCRMGADPRTSVVDGHNQSHDLPGLFVTDASAFPSASGVNPMITVMAIAAAAAPHIAEMI